MTEYRLEPDLKRVVISRVQEIAGKTRRILGELAYQLRTENGWCDIVEMCRVPDGVDVMLTGRTEGRSVRIAVHDSIRCGEDGLLVTRTWELPGRGRYRLFIDYRLETAAEAVLVPSYLYAKTTEHALRDAVAVDDEQLSFPSAFFLGEDVWQCLVAGAVSDHAARWETTRSDRRPAVQVRVPSEFKDGSEAFVAVGRRQGPEPIRIQFWVGIRTAPAPDLISRSHEIAWGWAGTGRATPGRNTPNWRHYVLARRAYLRPLLKERPGDLQGVAPAPDRRNRRPALLCAAVLPYPTLSATLALLLSGDIADDPEVVALSASVADFFCGGLQPDGNYCDVFDPGSRKWGTVKPETADFHRGGHETVRALHAGTGLARLYQELRQRGREDPRIIRVAAEIAHRVLRNQRPDGSFGSVHATASAVVLLSLIQRVRGRNSARIAALKRCAAYLSGSVGQADWFQSMAGTRVVARFVLQAGLDLVEQGISAALDNVLAASGAGLLTWIMTRSVGFPRRSPAARAGLDTKGLAVVSVERRHLDLEMLPVVRELLRWESVVPNAHVRDVAYSALAASAQLVAGLSSDGGPDGHQPAEIDYTRWSADGGTRDPRGRLAGARVSQASEAIVAVCDMAREFPHIVAI